MSDTSAVWTAWWDEAKQQLAVARVLVEAHGGSAIFHARMAVELAAKAVRLAPARVGNLHVPVGELAGYTIGQLGGLEAKKGHDPSRILDASWHPDEALQEVFQVVAEIERELGLEPNTLYEACRYPDRWTGGATAPHTRLTLLHAQRVVTAAARFLEHCSVHLGAGPGGVADKHE